MNVLEKIMSKGGIFNQMNKNVVNGIHEYMDEILEQWQSLMKAEKGERYIHLMPQNLVDKTSKEFAELMISNLLEEDGIVTTELTEFTEKLVRFGWSIQFINKAIDSFSQTVFLILEKKGIIKEHDFKKHLVNFMDWITPIRNIIINGYTVEWERKVSLQRVALQELSASLIPVFNKISVMPLVGTIDTERAKLIMENLLEGVVKQRAEVVLLDITGVPVVDTMVAHHIIQAADAVRLIGAKCMLVGIRPEIAQTIVALGIDLNDFTTTSTLQRGMEEALQLTNRKIVEVES